MRSTRTVTKQPKAPRGVRLSAVYSVLLSVAAKLANARVKWCTDNQNVVQILQVGNSKPDLHEIALRVFSLAVQYHISLEPYHETSFN